LRTGGRFNPELLEGIRVHLVKEGKESERLGDLAQILPRGGRKVDVLVGEADVCPSLIKYLVERRGADKRTTACQGSNIGDSGSGYESPANARRAESAAAEYPDPTADEGE